MSYSARGPRPIEDDMYFSFKEGNDNNKLPIQQVEPDAKQKKQMH